MHTDSSFDDVRWQSPSYSEFDDTSDESTMDLDPDPGLAEDPMFGNVNMLRVTPVNYSGKPKKGHLIFNATFESGNLAHVFPARNGEYDLYIRPDTCNHRQRCWFYFSVQNVDADQRVVFNIVNFSKARSLYNEGMAPVVKSLKRPKWRRIPSRHVHYYQTNDRDRDHVMSFAFAFDLEDDIYLFSYCFPYTYSQLQRFLRDCEKLRKPCFSRDVLTASVQHRSVDMITITEPSNHHLSTGRAQRVIFITARVHPGETPASYVCEGLIRFLLSENSISRKLRNNFVFKIVPMLNPDGVVLGNYRCSLMGFDLNRQWQTPSVWAHPTLYATKKFLLDYNDDPEVQLEYYVDIHAHSTLLSSFMYGNVYASDPIRCKRQVLLPTLFAEVAEDFSLEHVQFNTDASKAGTGRRSLGKLLDSKTLCYTLESSFFGYETRDEPRKVIPYSQELYRRLGESLALAFYKALEAEESGHTIELLPIEYFGQKKKSKKQLAELDRIQVKLKKKKKQKHEPADSDDN